MDVKTRGYRRDITPGGALAAQERDQESLNAELWARGDSVEHYATRELRAVESTLLERHRGPLGGRVLELGCGAGRLTGHLCELARVVQGVDISPAMIAYCRRTYPQAAFREGDLRDLCPFEDDSFDVIVAPFNVLDVLGDAERRRVLGEIRRILVTGGLLIMSSHNRGYAPHTLVRIRSSLAGLRRPTATIKNLPRRRRNRRRLRTLQREESGYAIINDEAHDFSVVHYYISRDAQQRQLADERFDLLECLDLDGTRVPAQAAAAACPELHYAARAR